MEIKSDFFFENKLLFSLLVCNPLLLIKVHRRECSCHPSQPSKISVEVFIPFLGEKSLALGLKTRWKVEILIWWSPVKNWESKCCLPTWGWQFKLPTRGAKFYIACSVILVWYCFLWASKEQGAWCNWRKNVNNLVNAQEQVLKRFLVL